MEKGEMNHGRRQPVLPYNLIHLEICVCVCFSYICDWRKNSYQVQPIVLREKKGVYHEVMMMVIVFCGAVSCNIILQ